MNSKIKKIITSRITIGIVCFILGGMILGSDGSEDPIKETANNQPQTSDEKSTEKPKSGNDLIQMNLGEQYSVKSSDGGEYNITIEGIRFTDERNQFSEKNAEHVVFLDYKYENVSSVEEVYVFESNFKIMDDEGNVLESYPVSDDNRSSKRLPIGGKSNASDAYSMPITSKTLKVLFYDNMYGKPLGQVTIETGL